MLGPFRSPLETAFIDSLLDLLVDFVPWKPSAWDVPLTRSYQGHYEFRTYSQDARRWVAR